MDKILILYSSKSRSLAIRPSIFSSLSNATTQAERLPPASIIISIDCLNAVPAGTALRQSIEIIIDAGGSLSACVVALDREEKIEGRIARDRLLEEYKINILSIAQISNLVEYLESSGKLDDAEIIKNHISRS